MLKGQIKISEDKENYKGWKNTQVNIGMKIHALSEFLRRSLMIFIIKAFGLLSSPLLLSPQRFGRYVFRPSSGVYRTREPTWNFEPRPLLNPRRSPILIPLAITGYKCKVFLYCYSPAVRIEPATSRWSSL